MLQLQNIQVGISDNSPILHNLSLTLMPGSIHALMGPNGSGKSTCAYTIMGHPWYQILSGSIFFNGHNITALSTDKRAQLGIFLALQQPSVLPGVTLFVFLKEMYSAISKQEIDVARFEQQVRFYMQMIGMDPSYLFRAVNDGFSGGEKKRCELLQMLVFKPHCIILDEIDSGLDMDALKSIAQVLEYLKQVHPELIVLIITHYQRLLEHLVPDHVHILIKGRLMTSGSIELVSKIERDGYNAVCV